MSAVAPILGTIQSFSTQSSQPTSTHSVMSAFESLKQFFQRLGQNIRWGWGVLVQRGGFAASLAIEAGCLAARAVLPTRVVNVGRTAALHIRAWWVELRSAREREQLEGRIRELEGENSALKADAERANQAVQTLSDQQRKDRLQCELLQKALKAKVVEVHRDPSLEDKLRQLTAEKETIARERDDALRQNAILRIGNVVNQVRLAVEEFRQINGRNGDVGEALNKLKHTTDAFFAQHNEMVSKGQMTDSLCLEVLPEMTSIRNSIHIVEARETNQV